MISRSTRAVLAIGLALFAFASARAESFYLPYLQHEEQPVWRPYWEREDPPRPKPVPRVRPRVARGPRRVRAVNVPRADHVEIREKVAPRPRASFAVVAPRPAVPAPARVVTPVDPQLEPLVKRAGELKDALVNDPAERTPDKLAAFEQALVAVENVLKAGSSSARWAVAFAVKARLLLALLDRAHEKQNLALGQGWLDILCPDAEPMVFRNIGGVRVVTRGDASRPEIALTFDGGPAADTTQLLDFLKAEDVKATWFLLGCFAEKDPATCKRIAAEGHVIANHTMTHAKWKGLGKISAEQGEQEIADGVRVIEQASGVKEMDLFRPPYGSGAEREDVNRIIARHHRYSIMWTVDSLDSMGAGLERQISRVLTSKKLNGAIILTHDHSKHIVTLVKTIVPELKRRGFRFVTVPELLAAGEARLRGERLAELCVAVQEGRIGQAFLGAQKAAGSGQRDRLGDELADLATMIQKLYPAQVAMARQPALSPTARAR